MTAWTRDARIGRSALVAAFLLIGSAGSVRAVEHTDLTPEQKGWVLATSAVLWERNADRHDLLAGRELTEANRRDQQVLVVDVYYRRLGAKGLLGWDYSRYVALCRWGYQSAYSLAGNGHYASESTVVRPDGSIRSFRTEESCRSSSRT